MVRRGDTLYSIAFRYGLDWRRVADWNRIRAPYTIHPGDVVRLREPRRRPVARVTPPSRPEPPIERPEARNDPSPRREEASGSTVADEDNQGARDEVEDGTTGEPAPDGTPTAPSASDPEPADSSPPAGNRDSRAPAPPGGERSVGGIDWRWPAAGRMVRAFDAGATRKGIGIAGQVGDPVHAAADGVVVYSGSGLLGYGELIIIKHSDSLLSAYGHNRARRVEEGDRVDAGQAIGELGVNERNDPMLHFEIRVDGQPENPLRYLPAR